jgi:hypothetical protein
MVRERIGAGSVVAAGNEGVVGVFAGDDAGGSVHT